MTLQDKEKLFVAQAFYNAIAEQVSTKNRGNLRDKVSQEYVDLYESTGAKSFDAKLLGEKVGTMSLTVSKPTESREEPFFIITDSAKFKAWGDFKAAALAYATDHLQDVADWHFAHTGEIPDGCEVIKMQVPGTPGGEVMRTTLKVDAKKVAEVLGGQLPEVTTALLEGEVA